MYCQKNKNGTIKHITYFNAFVDPGNQPGEKTVVEVFSEGISGIVGL